MDLASLQIGSILKEASKDDALLRDAFEGGKLLPYAGTSAKSNHGYARLLSELNVASPSRGACQTDILAFAFDTGDLEVRHRNRSGFVAKDSREVDAVTCERYVEALQAIGIDGHYLKSNATEVERARMTWGFGVQLCDAVRVGDEARLSMVAAGLDHVILLKPATAGGRIEALYFPHGVDNIRVSVEHYSYPVYASAAEAKADGQGVGATSRYAIVERNGRGHYGRPPDEAAMRAMLTEASYAIHDEKVSTTITTARAMITYPLPNVAERVAPVEDEPGQPRKLTLEEEIIAATEKARQRMKENDIGFLGYMGEVAPTLLKLDIDRDSDYRKVMAEELRGVIYGANRWSSELTGATSPAGGIGASNLPYQVAFKAYTVIAGVQSRIAALQNECISVVIDDEGFQDIIHAFADPLEGLPQFGGDAAPLTAETPTP